MKISAQIPNSSERLNYMQTSLHALLKNKYLYQTLITLADIQALTYSFMIKENPHVLSLLTQ